jgi:hypothetical protein
MLVRCVEADSVDVLMVELQEEFITITFGTFVEVFEAAAAAKLLPDLAALKYKRRKAVPVGGGATLFEAIMESVSELLEV